ncbi:MAG: hypothetical protein ACYC8V_14585 [Caulobacteraceae bacterium]
MTDAMVLDAVSRRLCWQAEWLGMPPHFGMRAPTRIRLAPDRAYVWFTDVIQAPYVQQTASYFEIERREGVPVVTFAEGFNMALRHGWPEYQDRHDLAYGPGSKTVEFTAPLTCPQSYDPSTPLKRRMIGMIEHTFVADKSLFFPKMHSGPMKIVIGSFNVDDPTAYVWIPRTGDVYDLGLHYNRDLETKVFEERAFLMTPEYDAAQRRETVRLIEQSRPIVQDVEMP